MVQAQVHLKETELHSRLKNKPSLWRRFLSFFFKQSSVETYRYQVQRATTALEEIRKQLTKEEDRLRQAKHTADESEAQRVQAQTAVDTAIRRFRSSQAFIDKGHQLLGSAFADTSWWNRSEAEIQMDVPWIDRELDDARSRLFIAAMRVHQSFIEQAATKLKKNIKLWVALLEKGWPVSKNKKHVLTLWQSAFLVIPVVSTTFASVQSMFKLLAEESIGWILIDEAGQAVPQAAIGALWRAKRAVVVGDPLQLEPVFTLQPAVVEGLRQHFDLKDCWNPYSYSVQGLADRVNPFGAQIMQRDEPLWVGCPLRVHRRCIDPMFSISNQIAYGGKMILAKTNSKRIDFPDNTSRWIQVTGICRGRHWVSEQGEAVISLLERIFSPSTDLPSVFVITPFKEVGNLIKRLLREQSLRWAPAQFSSVDQNLWLARSIGTVHTFQGKEADVVIFVLGLDQSKVGAAHWVSQKPNLLNVAALAPAIGYM